MALGAATVRQAGDELGVDEGAQLVWVFYFFYAEVFSFPESLIVKSRRGFVLFFDFFFVVVNLLLFFFLGPSPPLDRRFCHNLVCCFSSQPLQSAILRCVTWRSSIKDNLEKQGRRVETGYGGGEDESHGGGERICGEGPRSYAQVRTRFIYLFIYLCVCQLPRVEVWLWWMVTRNWATT